MFEKIFENEGDLAFGGVGLGHEKISPEVMLPADELGYLWLAARVH